MRYFSAQYLFTNSGPPVKRGIICTEDDGTIIRVEDSGGIISEKHSVEFYNGIIVPGFINCHCHLELSYLKNEIPAGSGLASFLMAVNSIRNTVQKDRDKAIREADDEMFREGIVLCADVCNTGLTFNLKKESRIKYINLLEVFGIDSSRADNRINEILELAKTAREMGLPHWIVPHAIYSTSLPLLRLIKKFSVSNKISSVHFMESADEETLLHGHSGPLMDSYKKFLPEKKDLRIAHDHLTAVVNEITSSGNLLLIHNTYVREEHADKLNKRAGLFWCLCPNSNLRIENKIPPAAMLAKAGCIIVTGTDSLSSNTSLSIIEELKTIQSYFPFFNLETIIGWATINGAKALCEDSVSGSIEPGKKPGLVLIKNADLINMKLLPGTTVQRLI
jgi:cytosine/adenosine deaminase-related metal-dependent hydrolase